VVVAVVVINFAFFFFFTAYLLNFYFNNEIFIILLKSIEAVEKLSSCSARLDDGRIIDLNTLDNPGSPR